MLNVVLPMSGNGSRFQKAGYLDPKPLIKIKGTPMFIRVLENLNLNKQETKYTIICKSDVKKQVEKYLQGSGFIYQIITVDSVTEGACCTVLLAKDIINTKDQLIIANCDQLVLDRLFMRDALNYFALHQAEGGIICFLGDEAKYSYAKVKNGKIIEVAEKKVISNLATVGIYWFAHGECFVQAGEEMIAQNIRTNNEFYLCPVYNQLIERCKVLPFMVNQMYGIGTPEDLEEFLKIY